MTALHPEHHVHFLHYVLGRTNHSLRERGEDGCCCEASEDYGGFTERGGKKKKSFAKVKLCGTGKLNRTICRIGNFFDAKKNVA